MTDLEATRLCAEAMGFNITQGERIAIHSGGTVTFYNPLHDDAQAMALVKRLKLQIGYSDGWACLKADGGELEPGAYHYETLNAAIVRCVAAMQQAKASAS